MEISVEEARKVVEAHYSEKGLEFSPIRSDAEVLRVYHNLQTFSFIEKMLGVAVDEAMKDIFKDWK